MQKLKVGFIPLDKAIPELKKVLFENINPAERTEISFMQFTNESLENVKLNLFVQFDEGYIRLVCKDYIMNAGASPLKITETLYLNYREKILAYVDKADSISFFMHGTTIAETDETDDA